MNIVQIGVNVSKDACYAFAKDNKDKIENIYLVEPLPSCIPDIQSTFQDFKNVNIFNIAISADSNVSSAKFYSIKGEPKTAQSSFNIEHLMDHGAKESEIESFNVECMTLNDFFEKNSITNCERLYIDTEGHDSLILLGFDYLKYNIKWIEFETLHTDGAFTQGDNYKKLIDRFEKDGYQIHQHKWNAIAKINS